MCHPNEKEGATMKKTSQGWFWGASLAIPAAAALASVNGGPDHLILTATESGRQHPANPWQYLLRPPTTPPELPITADLLSA